MLVGLFRSVHVPLAIRAVTAIGNINNCLVIAQPASTLLVHSCRWWQTFRPHHRTPSSMLTTIRVRIIHVKPWLMLLKKQSKWIKCLFKLISFNIWETEKIMQFLYIFNNSEWTHGSYIRKICKILCYGRNVISPLFLSQFDKQGSIGLRIKGLILYGITHFFVIITVFFLISTANHHDS